MPATIKIVRLTGTSPGTTSDITGINTVAHADDSHVATATLSSYPVRIPADATPNYSYWVTTQLYAVTLPSGTINAIKWHAADGTNNFGTGVDAVVGQAQTYYQATGTQGTTGTALTTAAHTGLLSAATPFTSYPSVSTPLSVTGSISTGGATGLFGNMVVYQLSVQSTASPGATGSETFTWVYDET